MMTFLGFRAGSACAFVSSNQVTNSIGPIKDVLNNSVDDVQTFFGNVNRVSSLSHRQYSLQAVCVCERERRVCVVCVHGGYDTSFFLLFFLSFFLSSTIFYVFSSHFLVCASSFV